MQDEDVLLAAWDEAGMKLALATRNNLVKGRVEFDATDFGLQTLASALGVRSPLQDGVTRR